VLGKVYFSAKRSATPTQVLESIRLGQLNVPYDSGEEEFNDLTDYGFGGDDLQTLTGEDCKGGSARKGSDGGPEGTPRNVLCVSAEPSGLAYRLSDDESDTPKVYSKQGYDLVLRAISKVGWYEYLIPRASIPGPIQSWLGRPLRRFSLRRVGPAHGGLRAR
jgi:primary-amine oxidase